MEFDGEFSECRIYSAFCEGEPPGEPKLSARCGVQLLKAEKFLGSARALPSRKTFANRQLLFAVHYSLFAIRHSPFATHCRFGSAGALPSQFIPSPVPRPTLLVPLKVGA
jgi:hypothetical protein